MPKHEQIYVNLPVADLAASRAFFSAMGYGFNEEFSNDKGACLVLGDNLFAMLLTHGFFEGFTSRPVADARTSTEVILCLSCTSRDELNSLVATAVAAGGTAPRPLVDHGFMVQHGFEDLDGHIWEVVHMVGAPG